MILKSGSVSHCYEMSFQLYYNSSFRVVIGFEDKKFDM